MPLPSHSRLFEKRAALLYDIARALTAPKEGETVFSAASLSDDAFRERYFASFGNDLSTCAEVNRAAVSQWMQGIALQDKVTVCRLIARELGIDTVHILPLIAFLHAQFSSSDDASEQVSSENRVVYLRSSYADEAFLRFASIIPDLRADYAPSFNAVCEDVYYEKANLCILPLENATDGTLVGFRSLILRHGLKVIATADVKTGEEEATRFALLKKDLRPIPGSAVGTDARFFRLTLQDRPLPLAQVLRAAQLCGLALHKVDAIPVSYGGEGFLYDLTFGEGTRADPGAFFAFLTLEVPEYEVVGVFTHREMKK